MIFKIDKNSKGVITEDGFAVDENEKVWMVVFNNKIPSLGHEVKVADANKRYGELYFKEKVNAEKFVYDNKLMFSAKEIETQFGWMKLQELYAMRDVKKRA